MGVLAALAAVGLLAVLAAGLYRGAHYYASVSEADTAGLTAQAAAYLGQNEGETGGNLTTMRCGSWRRSGGGDYLAALCTDDQGHWALCVYDRDRVFPDRWRANGGKPSPRMPGPLAAGTSARGAMPSSSSAAENCRRQPRPTPSKQRHHLYLPHCGRTGAGHLPPARYQRHQLLSGEAPG